MSYGVTLRVSGDYALFTRPEMKAERVSYDVITPSAARGVLEAVYWHPGLRWEIDRITVLNPILFDSIRRNELKSKIPYGTVKTAMKGGAADLHQYITEDRTQRASLLLRDVAYIIDAHFVLTAKSVPTDNEGKFLDCFNRRAKNGQCYHQPYLGCREFPAKFEPVESDSERSGYYAGEELHDLGYMLLDIDYGGDEKSPTFTPKFFRAEMKRGVISVPKGGAQ
jgi:CRISPR-associated protein Cas5 subtype I-C